MSQVSYSPPPQKSMFHSDDSSSGPVRSGAHHRVTSYSPAPSTAPKCWEEEEVMAMLNWLRPHKSRRRYANGLKANCCRELSEKVLNGKRPKQIRNKLEYMIREYQRARQVMKTYIRKRDQRRANGTLHTGPAIPDPLEAARKSCAFFDELNDIFGTDPEVVTDDEGDTPALAFSNDMQVSGGGPIRRPASLSPSLASTARMDNYSMRGDILPHSTGKTHPLGPSAFRSSGNSPGGLSLPPLRSLTGASSQPGRPLSNSNGGAPTHHYSITYPGKNHQDRQENSSTWNTSTGLPDLATFASIADSVRTGSPLSTSTPSANANTNSHVYRANSNPNLTPNTRAQTSPTPTAYSIQSLSNRHTPDLRKPESSTYASPSLGYSSCSLDTLAQLTTSPPSPRTLTTMEGTQDKPILGEEYMNNIQRQLQINYQRIYDLVQEQQASNNAFLENLSRRQDEFLDKLRTMLEQKHHVDPKSGSAPMDTTLS